MNEKLRVYAVTETLPKQKGYLDNEKIRKQYLQKKGLFGWITIDEETVPDWAVISLGCFGDTGGWVSKFAKYGSFGRDGLITSK
ncbi:hypothetical protein [Caulobacter phage Cr30]|uniref:hypothetical protein n=1 Tax=Caulobacter phage Cr30 TaxID=1357714 RepID=UPI0004A9B541|nr:hypothetical protein OZ74_gp159 [Caulobacter phage Cr30]AGS81044.1 hypothetical protein [Caulobacter phage Cr30]